MPQHIYRFQRAPLGRRLHKVSQPLLRPDGRTDGQTDRQTDRQAARQTSEADFGRVGRESRLRKAVVSFLSFIRDAHFTFRRTNVEDVPASINMMS